MSQYHYDNGLTSAVLDGANLGLNLAQVRNQQRQFAARHALEEQALGDRRANELWDRDFREGEAARFGDQFERSMGLQERQEERYQLEQQARLDAETVRQQEREQQAEFFRVLNREMAGISMGGGGGGGGGMMGMGGVMPPDGVRAPGVQPMGQDTGLGWAGGGGGPVAGGGGGGGLAPSQRRLMQLIDHGGPEVQGALYEHLQSEKGKRTVHALLDRLAMDPQLAGMIDGERAPGLRMIAQAAAELGKPETALVMAQGLHTQATKRRDEEKTKMGMAEMLASRPGPDGRMATDPMLMQKYMMLPLADVQADFQLALGQQTGIRRTPGGGEVIDDAMVAENGEALRSAFPSLSPQRAADLARLQANGWKLDLPEVSVSGRGNDRQQREGLRKSLDRDYDEARERLREAKKLAEGSVYGDQKADAAKAIEEATEVLRNARDRLDAFDMGEEIPPKAIPPGNPKAAGADEATLKQIGQQARAAFIKSKGRAPRMQGGKIVSDDVAELQKLAASMLPTAR